MKTLVKMMAAVVLPALAADAAELVKAEVPRLMAAVADLAVPLLAEVGVGTSWEEAH